VWVELPSLGAPRTLAGLRAIGSCGSREACLPEPLDRVIAGADSNITQGLAITARPRLSKRTAPRFDNNRSDISQQLFFILLKSGLAHRKFLMAELKPLGYASALVVLLSASSLLAQTTTTAQPSTSSPGITTQTTRNPRIRGARQRPCWQQVGIPQAAIERRKQIEENTRSQVQAVCHDSSLSPQQKREKIRQLREQARNEAEALLTPQQQEALRACREQHVAGRGRRGGIHRGGAGPCGEMPSNKHAQTEQESTRTAVDSRADLRKRSRG